jgi:uncharacterized protein (DUF1800 family)
MPLNLRSILVAASVSEVLLFLMACGSTNGSNPAVAPASVSVSINGSATVTLGSTAQYAAKVSGSGNQTVNWTVNQAAGGNSQFGTISATGLYSAPAAMPTTGSISIAAVSVADPGVSSSISVALQTPANSATGITVTGPATVNIGTTAQYAAVVAGTQNQSVTWAVNNVAGGNAIVGTIAASGLYTPPVSVPSTNAIVVTATSAATPGVSGNLNVTIMAPPTASPVTPTAAARFLDQTSFGPTAASIAHVQQIGFEAALAEQFNQPATAFSQPPSPDAECSTGNLHCTQSDFLKVTGWGNDQLRQRVAMALSELWVAPIDDHDNAMPFYLNTLANDAFTNYRTIMQDVTLTPQMGSYLNMVNSGAPAAGQIANENFGREVMQLFSLGPDLLNTDGTSQTDSNGNTIPAYTELQVEAFARAYTGWTNANPDGSIPAGFNYTPNWNYLMVPVESQHDTNEKIILLGTTLPQGQSAEQDLKGALDNIFAHPNAGPFVSRQLIQHLVTGNPSPGYVQRVAEVFDNNGSGVRGDMKAVLTAIILDQEARAGDAQTGDQAESNPAVDGGHLREPLLWTLNLLRALGATPTNPSDPYPFVYFMTEFMGTMGEAPFTQPSVFNYFSPSYVVPQTAINSPEFGLETTGTIVPRLSVANAIVHNAATGLNIDLSATSVIGQQAGNPAQLADYLGMLFMHSQMPTDMRSALITAISAIPATDLQSRAEVATYLVVTSSQYKIMH